MTTPDDRDTSTDAGARIEVRGLTKRFGTFTAVDDLTFAVEPGRITGFLGPNGAGKTTTLRMLLGLVRPTARHRDHRRPALRRHPAPACPIVGLGPRGDELPPRPQRPRPPARPGRHGRRRRTARVDELLELVGIPAAARKRAGGYSMGMRQRLGLAAALLGDPQVLILDEPANGLDPEGIRWLRGFLRHLAAEGKTILVSSHMLQEVEQTVDDVVIIANGRLVAQGADGRRCTATPTAVVRTLRPRRASPARCASPTSPAPRRGRHACVADTERPAPRRRRRPARRPADLRAASPSGPTSRRCSSSSPRAPRTATATSRARAAPEPDAVDRPRKGRRS